MKTLLLLLMIMVEIPGYIKETSAQNFTARHNNYLADSLINVIAPSAKLHPLLNCLLLKVTVLFMVEHLILGIIDMHLGMDKIRHIISCIRLRTRWFMTVQII